MKNIKEIINKIASYTRIDGLLHLETSALITLILCVIFPCYVSAIVTIVIGIGKELYDLIIQSETFDKHDIYFDLIGIASGMLLSILL